MSTTEKNKLKHDFINSVVIIKSMSKSAATFIDKISDKNMTVTDNQMKLFKTSMSSIQQEIANIEKLYQSLSEINT